MNAKLIEDFIFSAKNLNILVVGETIVDEFQPVIYEGQSMKSNCPVFRLLDRPSVKQEGGAKAIANHLESFVKKVTVITNTKEEIVKTRFIDESTNNKFIELNKFNTSGFGPLQVDCSEYDITIIADFGHGFCDQLKINDGFFLMCQTNSNNFGFNRVSKWKKHKKKGVCIDLREASLQMNKKIKKATDDHILELYNYELNTETLFVTTGAQGSVYTDGKKVLRQSSFPSQIVDTIGAGDAFFAFSCLLHQTSLPDKDYLAIPSLAASLTTTWLCNEKSVTKTSLKEYAARFI